MNRVILSGKLICDPTFNEAGTVGYIVIGQNRYLSSGKIKPEYFHVTLFGKNIETAKKYFSKGTALLVEGTVSNNRYGDKPSRLEIVLGHFEFLGTDRKEEQKEMAKAEVMDKFEENVLSAINDVEMENAFNDMEAIPFT